MKTIGRATLLLALLAACGGKPAQSPENAEGDGGASTAEAEKTDKSASDDKGGAPASGGATAPGDDSAKKKSPCSGSDIADLVSVLSQSECEVGPPKEGATPKDVKDSLDIKVESDSPKVAPGATAAITLTFKNKGKADLPLDFLVDPEPRFDLEVYMPKGGRADVPKGDAPALPPEVANATAPESKIARVTLAANGTARMTLKWNAVKYKWASKERAKGAAPGHGYPKDVAGPLTKGKYVLRVVTPLTNVAEGSDHEISQPRVPVEVGKP
jgi:hypothetical protein